MKRAILLLLPLSVALLCTWWAVQATRLTVHPIVTQAVVPRDAASASSSPYLALDAPTGAVRPASRVPYAAQIINYGKTARVITVTTAVPANAQLAAAGAFSVTGTTTGATLRWQGSLPGAHLSYTAHPINLPYVDLAAYGVPSICASLPDGGSCDDLIAVAALGELATYVTFFERRLDYLLVGANGFVAGPLAAISAADFMTNSTGINRPLPLDDTLNQVGAPLWRDNVIDAAAGHGVYVAIVEQLTPTAAQALYINWHVALAAAPHAVAEYGIALDLGDSGYIYFIYNHVAAPDDVAAAGYTIGLEDADGERGYLHAYAPPDGAADAPSGFLPSARSAIQWRPHYYADPQVAQMTLPFALTAPDDPRATVHTTVFGRTSGNTFWSTAVVPVRDLTYLPLVASNRQIPESP